MASISSRKDKDGNIISYIVRVYRGNNQTTGKHLKPFTKTFKVPKGKTEKQIKKELDKFALDFERECEQGYVLDNKQTFADYAEYVLKLKEQEGVKRSTISNYRKLLERVNEGIGTFKLHEIRPQHLNKLYEQLKKNGLRENGHTARAKLLANGTTVLAETLKERGLTFKFVAQQAGIAVNTFANAVHGKNIAEDKAKAIATALDEKTETLFDVNHNMQPLSDKTVLEYHHVISAVLRQAEKELLIPYNPASKASPPKVKPKEANYYDEYEIAIIRDTLELLPLKWKTAIHLLLVTGARRGEVVGLKWKNVDFKNRQIYICNNLLYEDGDTYEDTPKTTNSQRYIKLPVQTMELLKEYRQWQLEQKTNYGALWHETDYVFTQDNGEPMNPTSLTSYCGKLSEKFPELPHINPHAFRHTMVSILYFNKQDSISISHRLGHSKVSTTTDKYGHIMRKADEAAADCIADVIFNNPSEPEKKTS